MAARYVARYVFVMLTRMIALAAALCVSLATNIWLATRPPVVMQASAAPQAQCEPAAPPAVDARAEEAPSLASFARVVEESKRARAAAKDAPRADRASARAL